MFPRRNPARPTAPGWTPGLLHILAALICAGVILFGVWTVVKLYQDDGALHRTKEACKDTRDELDEMQEKLDQLLADKECCADTVDVVVLGAGPAGCAVVHSLWKHSNLSVVLIETGADLEDPSQSAPFFDYDLKIPSNAGSAIQRRPDAFYGHIGVNAIPFATRPIAHTIRGSALGGGGKVNGMQWVQPSEIIAAQMDAAVGNPGVWTFANQQAVFNEMETFYGTTDGTRGTMGPQSVEEVPRTVSGQHWSAAITAVTGLAHNEDYNNGAKHTGPIDWQLSTRYNFSERASPDIVLLTDEVRNSPRVKILTRSTGIAPLLDGLTITGVRYEDEKGECKCINARETVLAMNTGNSIFLEQNGIGDAALLNQLGIPVLVDNPAVGKLHNHWGFRFEGDRPLNVTGVADPNQLYEWGAFTPLPGKPYDYQVREVQWIGFGGGPGKFGGFVLWNTRNVTGEHHITKRGSHGTPMTDEKAYVETGPGSDTAVVRRIIREQLVEYTDWLEANYPGYKLTKPSPATIADDNLLNQYIRANSGEGYHYTLETALGAVVDKYLRVIGTTGGLRVVGSSVALLNDGNLHAVSQMIGWMCGLFISQGN